MLELLSWVTHTIQPLIVPLCFIVAWTSIIVFAWSLWTATRDTVNTAKQMHQIPCASCQFFTNNYRLKCTVHPLIANTEEAINCSDFQAKTDPYLY